MDSLQTSIQRLAARLPELEWKLEGITDALNLHQLPRGLFRAQTELTPDICMAEIKSELQHLSQQKNEASARYLSERIHNKINVLVKLCKLHAKKNIPKRHPTFGVRALSTRQQWLQTLTDDITKLTEQSQALTARLQTQTEPTLQLILRKELGEIEQRLTLAKETLARATSWS